MVIRTSSPMEPGILHSVDILHTMAYHLAYLGIILHTWRIILHTWRVPLTAKPRDRSLLLPNRMIGPFYCQS